MPRSQPASRSFLVTTLAAVMAVVATSTHAQQVVGHLPQLPSGTGRNPETIEATLAHPDRSALFVLDAAGFSVIVPATGITAGWSNDGARLDRLALDPSGERLYAAGYRELAVIEATTGALLTRAPIPLSVRNIAVDPARGRLVLGGWWSGPRLQVYDSASLTLVAEQPGFDLLAVNPASGKVYGRDDSGSVVVAFDADLLPLATIPIASAVAELNPAAGPEGQIVIRAGDDIHLIDSATDSLVATVSVSDLWDVAVDPASGRHYAAGWLDELVEIDPSGDSRRVPSPVRIGSGGSLTVDGIRRRVVVENARGTGPVAVFDTTPSPPVLAWSGTAELYDDPVLDPTTGLLYSNDVRAIVELDPATPATRRLALGASLAAAAASDRDGLAYVIDDVTDRLLTTRLGGAPTVTATTAIGAGSELVVHDPTRDELYVVSDQERTIHVLDAATGLPLRTAPGLAGNTVQVALDPDAAAGSRLYIHNALYPYSPSVLQIYEPATDTFTDFQPGCASDCRAPEAIALDVGRRLLYILQWNDLYSYDLDTHALASRVPFDLGQPGWADAAQLVADPVSGRLFASINIFILDDVIGPVLWEIDGDRFTHIPGGEGVTRLELADRQLAELASWNGATLFGIDDGNRVLKTIPADRTAGFADIHLQAGTGLLYADRNDSRPSDVEVHRTFSAVTLADLDAVDCPGNQRAFRSLTGGRVAFANNRHGTIAVIDPAATGLDLQIDASPLPDATPGTPYSYNLGQSGGRGPFRWEVVSGALPDGLVLDATTGTVAGTPTGPSMRTFLVRLTDLGQSPPVVDVASFSLRSGPMRILTSRLPEVACADYSVALYATGGTPPYSWTASGLPAWLHLEPTSGLLSGSPSGPTTCPPDVTITVEDSVGARDTVSLCVAGTPAGVPVRVDDVKLRADAGGVRLDWSYPDTAMRYEVARSTDRGTTWTVVSTLLPGWVDANAGPGLTLYEVHAIDRCGAASD